VNKLDMLFSPDFVFQDVVAFEPSAKQSLEPVNAVQMGFHVFVDTATLGISNGSFFFSSGVAPGAHSMQFISLLLIVRGALI